MTSTVWRQETKGLTGVNPSSGGRRTTAPFAKIVRLPVQKVRQESQMDSGSRLSTMIRHLGSESQLERSRQISAVRPPRRTSIGTDTERRNGSRRKATAWIDSCQPVARSIVPIRTNMFYEVDKPKGCKVRAKIAGFVRLTQKKKVDRNSEVIHAISTC